MVRTIQLSVILTETFYVLLGIIVNTFCTLSLNINAIDYAKYYFGSVTNNLAFLPFVVEGIGYIVRPLSTISITTVERLCGGMPRALELVTLINFISHVILLSVPNYDISLLLGPIVLSMSQVISMYAKAFEHPNNTLQLLKRAKDYDVSVTLIGSALSSGPIIGVLLLLSLSIYFDNQFRKVLMMSCMLTGLLYVFRVLNRHINIFNRDNNEVEQGFTGILRYLKSLCAKASTQPFLLLSFVSMIFIFQANAKTISGWWLDYCVRNDLLTKIDGKYLLMIASVISVLLRNILPTVGSNLFGARMSFYCSILFDSITVPLLFYMSYQGHPLEGLILVNIPHSLSHGLLLTQCQSIFKSLSQIELATMWNATSMISFVFLPLNSLVCYNLGGGIAPVCLMSLIGALLCILSLRLYIHYNDEVQSSIDSLQ